MPTTTQHLLSLLLTKNLCHKVLVAHDVSVPVDLQPSVDLDPHGPRSAVLVNHGNPALTGAVLLDGVDDGASNGVGVLSGGLVDADVVVVAGDSDGGVDSKRYARLLGVVGAGAVVGVHGLLLAAGDE